MKKETWLSLFFVALLEAAWSGVCSRRTGSIRKAKTAICKPFPSRDADQIFSGKFGSRFESYITDQFPARDGWVALKTITQLGLGTAGQRPGVFR